MIQSKEFHDGLCEGHDLTLGFLFKRRPIIIRAILAAAAVLTLTTIQLTYAQAQTGFWTLGVTVNNIPTDVDTVTVSVKGPFNDIIYKTIDASTSARAFTSFDISTDKIPDGYDYKVCVHGAGASLDWCQPFNHNGGSTGYVRVTWP
jgi:hypothetical protein